MLTGLVTVNGNKETLLERMVETGLFFAIVSGIISSLSHVSTCSRPPGGQAIEKVLEAERTVEVLPSPSSSLMNQDNRRRSLKANRHSSF